MHVFPPLGARCAPTPLGQRVGFAPANVRRTWFDGGEAGTPAHGLRGHNVDPGARRPREQPTPGTHRSYLGTFPGCLPNNSQNPNLQNPTFWQFAVARWFVN